MPKGPFQGFTGNLDEFGGVSQDYTFFDSSQDACYVSMTDGQVVDSGQLRLTFLFSILSPHLAIKKTFIASTITEGIEKTQVGLIRGKGIFHSVEGVTEGRNQEYGKQTRFGGFLLFAKTTLEVALGL